MYLKCDLKTFDLSSLGTKFDVILIDPPLEEYQRKASGITFNWTPFEWEDVSVCGRGCKCGLSTDLVGLWIQQMVKETGFRL